MRRTLIPALPLAALLLLMAGRAEARLVQSPETERGGHTLQPGAAVPCATMSLGWFLLPDLEAIARVTAAARADLVLGRPFWRSPRLVGRRPLRPNLPRLR